MSPKQPYTLARDIAFQNHPARAGHKPRLRDIVAKETFSSFHAIGEDVVQARVLAGLHYRPSCDTALVQGRKVTANILRILNLH